MSPILDTAFAATMIARANHDKLGDDHPLRLTAVALAVKGNEFFGEPQRCTAAQLCGAWGNARKAWSDYTGEPIA